MINAAKATDGYKVDHRRQYPPGTSFVFSNLTARSARLSNIPEHGHENKVVFFGARQFIERFILKFWDDNFFSRPENEVMQEYTDHVNAYLGPNQIGNEHLRELYQYGRMPIVISAVPEGTRVPIQVPCMTIENYDPENLSQFFWVTNYLETLLSAEMWKPMTSATTAFAYRRLIDSYCKKTGGSPDFVPFQGHDFSFRGMSGFWDACVSGTAHLTSFYGTDTVPAIQFAKNHYDADKSEMIGASVAASEHSVMCMGTKDDEIGTFRRFINDLYKTGVVSIVSDTWDYWQVLTEYAVTLKDEILARDGKVVFRPDSGDPVKIVCGYRHSGMRYPTNWAASMNWRDESGNESEVVSVGGKYYKISWNAVPALGFEIGEEIPEHEVKGSIQCLWDVFGGIETDKGFRTLDPHVGLIYGDSITYERCEAILERLAEKGFSSDNVVFGIGSYTYQYVTRDTYGMAVKATFGIVDGEHREIFKDPKTGSGKKSAKGLLAVCYSEDLKTLELRQEIPYEDYRAGIPGNVLEKIFEDGNHLIKPTLEEIRCRLLLED